MGKRRKTTKKVRLGLYAAKKYLNSEVERELGVQIPFHVYLQDPFVAESDPKFGIDENFFVPWEPGLTDGPTSARFAVVDYNGDTGELIPMAKWDKKKEKFLDEDGIVIDKGNTESIQFDQQNVWAILQRALDFFENGSGLGRRIPFGFEGNRLIVVPHAGYGQNAFYDRKSKSLQFYYFDQDDKRIYTCLSADIINHEFGHAMLDGIRPYYFESSLVQTGAFHEFIGDLSAILIILRNNVFRGRLAERTDGRLTEAKQLSSIAEQFGHAISDNPYLRTAQNSLKMSDIEDEEGPHRVSEVLTGTMYDILLELSDHYLTVREETAKQAFWHAIDRMYRMSIQPLDLLPPVDVTFKDYAIAVLRSEALSNPTDPYQFYELLLKAFVKREVLTEDDAEELRKPRYLYERLRVKVFHDIIDISSSRATAYRFLDDNRTDLLIPPQQDIIIADLYDSQKLTREARRLPRQIILEYIWRENIKLEGPQFGDYQGQTTDMLCGGTLVFDENGTVLSWVRKPGTQGGTGDDWENEIKDGKQRKEELLKNIARRINSGHVGSALGSSKGMIGSLIPPLNVRKENGILKFELSPHLSLKGEDHEHYKGGKKWEVSS